MVVVEPPGFPVPLHVVPDAGGPRAARRCIRVREEGLTTESIAGLEAVYRRDGRRIFASLVRLLGSFERAEEAEHDAFMAAAEQWPRDGVPRNPVAWLVSVGRFKAIDRMRREARFTSIDDRAEFVAEIPDLGQGEPETIEDDRLRLIFTCCHPSLSEAARIALTLREVCGLATEDIACLRVAKVARCQ